MMSGPVRSRPAIDASTSILTFDKDVAGSNCLAQALRAARDGIDEIVFLGAPPIDGQPGHVVLVDVRTAAVREPGAGEAAEPLSVEAYAATLGHAVLCAAPAKRVRDIVGLPVGRRAAALAGAGGPLQGIAHLPFGAPVGAVNPALYKPPAKTDPADPAKNTDKDVHAWTDALGDKASDDDKKALTQTGDDAHLLLSWFDAHKRGDQDVLKKAPDAVNQAWDHLLANDAVHKQIVNGKDETNRDDLGKFVDGLDTSAKSAKSTFDAFIKDNKTPDPIALRTAVDGSILQANATIIDGGSKDSKIDQKFNLDDLKATATGDANKSLPDAVKHAAALYADQGHFTGLSNAGLDPSTTSNGLVANKNFDSLLSKNTSKSEDDSISALRSAATQQAVRDAGGDGSKVGADYFTNGKTDASGADKASALFQLSEAVGRYKSGEKAYNPPSGMNPKTYTGEGSSPGQQRDDFVKDVQGRIDKLSADKNVQQFVADKVPGALQGIVGSDPALKGAVQKRLDETSGSKALEDAFGQKAPDGKPLSTTDALGAFIAKPTFYGQALATTPDLTKALGGASKDIQDKVKSGYDDITSGKDLANLKAQGVPDDKAIIQTTTNKAVYDSVLDAKTVEDGNNKFADSVTKVGRDTLTNGLTMDDILKGLGVKGADDPKLQEFINNNLVTIVGPNGGSGPTASAILSGVRSMDDMIRGGTKFDDAYVKLQKALGNNDVKSGLPTNVTDSYKVGYMHGVSSLLLVGAIGARAATGNQGDKLATAAQSLSAAGLMTEGGSKYYQTKLAEINKNPGAVSKSDFANWTNAAKDVENVGKSIGGVAGNVLGAVVGGLFAKKSADSGDTGGAAAQGVFAGLNGISAIAGGAEVAAYVVPRVFSSVAASSTAALGALAGAVGGVVGGAAAVGGLIYAIVKDVQETDKINRQRDKWYDTISSDLKPFGVTVPDAGILASDPNADPNAPPFLPPVT